MCQIFYYTSKVNILSVNEDDCHQNSNNGRRVDYCLIFSFIYLVFNTSKSVKVIFVYFFIAS